ncbi:MAG: efflux RND transporter permease subunit, partial [Alphaproteobacteria bacterium]|nr:efflux RND transporter permease subunit [Alphaproteobacteria bacterium]
FLIDKGISTDDAGRTAAAASLGMIPIAGEVFWSPMAFAMIGGIVVATLLTLLFLPALYVIWYRIKEPAA